MRKIKKFICIFLSLALFITINRVIYANELDNKSPII